MEAFDWADRWNARTFRAAAVGFPVWLALLLGLGWAGAGPLAGFVVASLVATILVVVLEVAVFRQARVAWNDRAARVGALAFTLAPVAIWLTYPLWDQSGASEWLVWGGVVALVVGGVATAVLTLRAPRERP